MLDYYARMPTRLPVAIAKQVVDDAEKYPLLFVGLAEERLLMEAHRQTSPVGRVAANQEWFV